MEPFIPRIDLLYSSVLGHKLLLNIEEIYTKGEVALGL